MIDPTEAILWGVLVITLYVSLALFIIAWKDRPMVMRHPELGHYVSVRSWQKEQGYGRR